MDSLTRFKSEFTAAPGFEIFGVSVWRPSKGPGSWMETHAQFCPMSGGVALIIFPNGGRASVDEPGRPGQTMRFWSAGAAREWYAVHPDVICPFAW